MSDYYFERIIFITFKYSGGKYFAAFLATWINTLVCLNNSEQSVMFNVAAVQIFCYSK